MPTLTDRGYVGGSFDIFEDGTVGYQGAAAILRLGAELCRCGPLVNSRRMLACGGLVVPCSRPCRTAAAPIEELHHFAPRRGYAIADYLGVDGLQFLPYPRCRGAYGQPVCLVLRGISQNDVVGVVGSMADPNLTQTWSGAVAAVLSATVGFLGLWLVPKWAKKTELTRTDSALSLDADVRSRADLNVAFLALSTSQQKRIEQLAEQLEESVKDRANLWGRVEKLTDEVTECERKNSEQALSHFVEMTALKTQLNDCQRELVDIRNKSSC